MTEEKLDDLVATYSDIKKLRALAERLELLKSKGTMCFSDVKIVGSDFNNEKIIRELAHNLYSVVTSQLNRLEEQFENS